MASIALSLVVLLLAAPAAPTGSWQRPVDGPVLRAFALGADPYARGQHRGVDLGASPGSVVRSACAGRVGFAGRVPGGGRTVSVRCGEVLATYQQLATIVVRVGQRIALGAQVGLAGRSSDPRTRRPHLHLGAREAASGRYLDPLTLLRGAPPAIPLLPPAPATRPRFAAPRRAPAPALPRAVPLGRAPAPALPRAVRSGPTPASPRAAVPASDASRAVRPGPTLTLPWAVWAGLASIGLALPIGGIVTVRRRERGTSARAVATSR